MKYLPLIGGVISGFALAYLGMRYLPPAYQPIVTIVGLVFVGISVAIGERQQRKKKTENSAPTGL